MANKTDGSMGGFAERSPQRRKRMTKRAESQDKRWAAKSSKIAITFACIRPSPHCQAASHDE